MRLRQGFTALFGNPGVYAPGTGPETWCRSKNTLRSPRHDIAGGCQRHRRQARQAGPGREQAAYRKPVQAGAGAEVKPLCMGSGRRQSAHNHSGERAWGGTLPVWRQRFGQDGAEIPGNSQILLHRGTDREACALSLHQSKAMCDMGHWLWLHLFSASCIKGKADLHHDPRFTYSSCHRLEAEHSHTSSFPLHLCCV